MKKKVIHTDQAPQAIGAYSQAVAVSGMLYLSGQIPLDPQTMNLVQGNMDQQVSQIFENLSAVCQAAGCGLEDIVKLNVYLTDFADYACLNEVTARYLSEPYPARAVVQVSALPKGAKIEIEAVATLAK